ncbi:hypothetical protein BDZ91DRAFT_802569 [Kalaharituber pfeilii]|nr:hypothetical protein BDZ91DRAFT_802569 [Kalaharituber pfeilii]
MERNASPAANNNSIKLEPPPLVQHDNKGIPPEQLTTNTPTDIISQSFIPEANANSDISWAKKISSQANDQEKPLDQPSTNVSTGTFTQSSISRVNADISNSPVRKTNLMPPTYPVLTFQRICYRTIPNFLANLVLEVLFCVTLGAYQAKPFLDIIDKRWFNMIAIMLCATMSIGIGYLLDQVGVLLRGCLLQIGTNTKQEISHIVRCSLGTYTLLIWSHLKRKSWDVSSTLAFLFVISSFGGRLSVGFLGLTYNDNDMPMDGTLEVTEWYKLEEDIMSKRNQPSIGINNILLDSLLRIAPQEPLPEDLRNSTNSGIMTMSDWDTLKVPELTLIIDDQGAMSSAMYSYTLKYAGEKEKFQSEENRTIQINSTCARVEALHKQDLSHAGGTYFPLTVNKTESGSNAGWLLYAYHSNAFTCGPNCILMGACVAMSDALNKISVLKDLPCYDCQITVEYTGGSSFFWYKLPSECHPSQIILLELSKFLLNDVIGCQCARGYFTTIWSGSTPFFMPKWSVPGGLPVPILAGVLARSVAIVVKDLDTWLPKSNQTVGTSQDTSKTLLSVKWQRLFWILIGITGLQVLVMLLGGWVMSGTLVVEDDLKSINALLAEERFPTEEENDKPWVIVEKYKDGNIGYKFIGLVSR